MRKKFFKILTAISFGLLLSNTALAVEIAKPTSQNILLNAKEVKCEVYNIKGSNYFKLRDVAAILNGTSAQFSIEYDGAIYITTNNEYISVGDELAEGHKENQIAYETLSSIFINGVEVFPYTYNINGNNYFSIRYLGENLNFDVNYDYNTNTVLINADTHFEYDVKAIDSDDSIPKKRKQFDLYKSKMNEAQNIIKKLYDKVKKEEGTSKSKEQICAYIALNSWMTEKNAKELKFVRLDSKELKEKYNIILPSIEGTMRDGKKFQSDYFLTAEGKIFIYPPYIYNSEEYINSKAKIVDEKMRIGKIDFTLWDITTSRSSKDIPITEESTEEIEIFTSFNTGFKLDKKEVIEFSFLKNNYPGFSLIVRNIDLRNDEITADIYCNEEKIVNIEELYPYCEEKFSNISTGQVYFKEEYFYQVLTIKFYRNGKLFAEGKIKIIK